MAYLADLHPAALYGLTLALGLLVGSFLNVVILRLPARLRAVFCRGCVGSIGRVASPPSFEATARMYSK